MSYKNLLYGLLGEYVTVSSSIGNLRTEYHGFLQITGGGDFFIQDIESKAGVMVCSMHNQVTHNGNTIDANKIQV